MSALSSLLLAAVAQQIVDRVRGLYLLPCLVACGRVGFNELEPARPDAPDALDELPVTEPCDARSSSDTVALYAFETVVTADSTAVHDAARVGDVTRTGGRCGEGAGAFTGGSHLVVPASPAFDLDEGSIELFARVTAHGTPQGLVARDANGWDFDGHMSIGVSETGAVYVRLQRTGNVTVFRCSAPIPAHTWVHVATSFGPRGFALWIDGAPATATTFTLYGNTQSCTTPHTFGIAGNANTVVIGALNNTAPNAAPMPNIVDPLDGAIDQLRIRSTWRDFGE